MLAIRDQQDQVTQRMRICLKTTGMGLGLVRLLMDAGMTEEARTTLASLGNGYQGIAESVQCDANQCHHVYLGV
jgi:hypothetical protein